MPALHLLHICLSTSNTLMISVSDRSESPKESNPGRGPSLSNLALSAHHLSAENVGSLSVDTPAED